MPSSALPASLASPSSLPSPLAHPDLLRRILCFAERPTLCKCLRVNHDFLDLAGEMLYRFIDHKWFDHHELRISDVLCGAAQGTGHLRPQTGRPIINFKTQLLKHVRVLDVSLGKNHWLCALADVWAGCEQLVSLETLRFGHDDFGTRLYPAGGCDDEVCPLRELHPSKIVIHDVAMDTEVDPYFPVIEKAARVTLILFELVEPQGRDHRYYQEGLASPLAICRHLRQTDSGHCSEGRSLRLLFVGTDPFDGYETDDSEEYDLSEVEDDLWKIAVEDLYDLLDMGVEVFLCSDPDKRSVVQQLSPRDGRYGLEIDALNQRLRKRFERRKCPVPPVLVQSRADYLRLPDNADEFDRVDMDELRKDEAEYQRRKAEEAEETAKAEQSD